VLNEAEDQGRGSSNSPHDGQDNCRNTIARIKLPFQHLPAGRLTVSRLLHSAGVLDGVQSSTCIVLTAQEKTQRTTVGPVANDISWKTENVSPTSAGGAPASSRGGHRPSSDRQWSQRDERRTAIVVGSDIGHRQWTCRSLLAQRVVPEANRGIDQKMATDQHIAADQDRVLKAAALGEVNATLERLSRQAYLQHHHGSSR
jgi:hypothetical protein